MRNPGYRLLVTTLISLVTASCQEAAQVDNPEYMGWRSFKVGAWVKYSVETHTKANPTLNSTVTRTLKELTDTQAVVEEVSENHGEEDKDRETVTLKIPARIDEGRDSEGNGLKHLSKGKEEVLIKGRKFACDWVETRVGEGEEAVRLRIWTSDKIVGGRPKITAAQEKGEHFRTSMIASDWKDGKK